MRIGHLNQVMRAACDEQNKIEIKSVAIYGGQAYTITNYGAVRLALTSLYDRNLLAVGDEAIDSLFREHPNENSLQVDNQTYHQLTSLVNSVNTQLPVIMQVLENFSPEQEENIINIKLPEGIDSLQDLESFNKRLQKIFKQFKLTGEFKLVGFDAGSEWEIIQIVGDSLYRYFLGVISIAYIVAKTRESWWKGSETKLAYKIAKKKDKSLTKDEYIEEVEDAKVETEAEKLVAQLGTSDNNSEGDLVAMVKVTTKSVIKEITNGTEFHLSLNPPKYLTKDNTVPFLEIDYSLIPKIEEPTIKTAKLKERIDNSDPVENSKS